MLDAPDLFAALAYLHPEVEVSFHELQFPVSSTAKWLEEVDVALCFSPTPHPDVQLQPIRVEQRVVVAARDHPLARRRELDVAEVLDETFPGHHPSVDPAWVGFWQLDDERGEPPRLTDDHAINPHEMAAIIASGRAITTMPASDAANVVRALTSVVAIPLRDADPAVLSLVWRRDNAEPARRGLRRDGATTSPTATVGGAHGERCASAVGRADREAEASGVGRPDVVADDGREQHRVEPVERAAVRAEQAARVLRAAPRA